MLNGKYYPDTVEVTVGECSDVFKDELGTMNAELRVENDTTPCFHRPRSVPYALKEAVEEIHQLEEAGVHKKINHCEWAVPVPKKHRKVHGLQGWT